jgi:hypothetical protein
MLPLPISIRFVSFICYRPEIFRQRISKSAIGLPCLIVRTFLVAAIVATIFLIGSADAQTKSMSNGIVSDKKDAETAIIPVIQIMPLNSNVVTGLESASELAALLRDSSR